MGNNADRDELTEDVRVMRALGVLRWKDIELGPEPLAGEEPESRPRMSREEVERRRREERRRVALGASGGPLPRTGDGG